MRILQHGKPKEEWIHITHCTGEGNPKEGCGALVELHTDDLFYTAKSYMGKEETRYLTFQCAECDALTDIYSTDDPGYNAHLRHFVYEVPSYTEWRKTHVFP